MLSLVLSLVFLLSNIISIIIVINTNIIIFIYIHISNSIAVTISSRFIITASMIISTIIIGTSAPPATDGRRPPLMYGFYYRYYYSETVQPTYANYNYSLLGCTYSRMYGFLLRRPQTLMYVQPTYQAMRYSKLWVDVVWRDVIHIF